MSSSSSTAIGHQVHNAGVSSTGCSWGKQERRQLHPTELLPALCRQSLWGSTIVYYSRRSTSVWATAACSTLEDQVRANWVCTSTCLRQKRGTLFLVFLVAPTCLRGHSKGHSAAHRNRGTLYQLVFYGVVGMSKAVARRGTAPMSRGGDTAEQLRRRRSAD